MDPLERSLVAKALVEKGLNRWNPEYFLRWSSDLCATVMVVAFVQSWRVLAIENEA